MKGIAFRLFVFVLFFYITNYNVIYGQMCTSDICQKCCHPTNDGFSFLLKKNNNKGYKKENDTLSYIHIYFFLLLNFLFRV